MTEAIVSDMVGHQDRGEVPAMDEHVCMKLYQNQLWFKVRKMGWMAPRVEGLLEEEWKEEEEAMAKAEESLVGSFSGPASGVQQFKADSISQPASGNTFSHRSMVSMLGKEFGDVGEAKGGSTMGSQFLEQFKTAQALAQLAVQHSQTGSNTTSSWDMGSMTQSPLLVQYDLMYLNDSTVHSPFTKCQAFTPSSTMMEVFLQEKSPAVATSTAAPPPQSSPLLRKSTLAP
ncbi:hypothetical protein P7K49_030018 [Saguinus oedipus]|uniref:Uncharacterized protein n=1 Tax=Saguinus oedipus TaxID=9490 RepID=A0ABQ9U0Z9_SAGOE|nr:hypothetical protein P7K49_030018 [Saguinus oedipus]